MKKKVLMVLLAATLSVSMIAGCGSKGDNNTDTTKTESKQDSDQEAADKVAKLIDDIYVQERTDKTDEQCTAAKEAWDALTDAQKELVERMRIRIISEEIQEMHPRMIRSMLMRSVKMKSL